MSLLLLLASMVGLVEHDHGASVAGVERGAVACSVDHEQAPGLATAGSGPGLRAAAEHHQHHCLGCRHTSQRGSIVTPPATAMPGPDTEASPAVPPSPPLARPTTGASPRGPPTT